jgi:dTDP-4-dehydrorhamnose reductase
MVHMSTDYVFDGTKADGSYREDDPVNPLGVYGRTKLAGEVAVRERLREHIILRTSWVFGVYGRNFLKTIAGRSAEQAKLRVVADQRGCPTSTQDIADAILWLRAPALAGMARWGIYNFAGSGETTWYGFAERIVARCNGLTGRDTVVEAITSAEYPTPARRPANSALDSGLFARTFGFAARHWAAAPDATVAALLGPTKAAARPRFSAQAVAAGLE